MLPYSRAGQLTGAEFRAIREQQLQVSPAELARLMNCKTQTIWNIEGAGGKQASRLMVRLLYLLCDAEVRARAHALAAHEEGHEG